jgi:hypothetical protein
LLTFGPSLLPVDPSSLTFGAILSISAKDLAPPEKEKEYKEKEEACG